MLVRSSERNHKAVQVCVKCTVQIPRHVLHTRSKWTARIHKVNKEGGQANTNSGWTGWTPVRTGWIMGLRSSGAGWTPPGERRVNAGWTPGERRVNAGWTPGERRVNTCKISKIQWKLGCQKLKKFLKVFTCLLYRRSPGTLQAFTRRSPGGVHPAFTRRSPGVHPAFTRRSPGVHPAAFTRAFTRRSPGVLQGVHPAGWIISVCSSGFYRILQEFSQLSTLLIKK